MKAVICTNYGSPDVLRVDEVNTPVPKDNEVRIQIHASTVNSGDCRTRGFVSPLIYKIPMRLVLGIWRPRQPILGVELTGVVESIGKAVTRFKPGDRVAAFTGMKFGAHAEMICLPEKAKIVLLPANVSYQNAAALLFGGTTALHFFRKANLSEGHKVLIYGASGAVGTASVQLAKQLGAQVTAVCSGHNKTLVSSLGADQVLDYKTNEFAEHDQKYDIFFDAVGLQRKSLSQRWITTNGTYITVDGQGVARVTEEDIEYLLRLLSTNQVRSVIDRTYSLAETADAHRYVETGRKRGSVVIAVRE